MTKLKNLGSDRTVPPLRKGADNRGFMLLGGIILAAILAFVWLLPSGEDKVEEPAEPEEYREVKSNDYELPKIEARPPVREVPEVKPAENLDASTRPDPRELERTVIANRDNYPRGGRTAKTA